MKTLPSLDRCFKPSGTGILFAKEHEACTCWWSGNHLRELLHKNGIADSRSLGWKDGLQWFSSLSSGADALRGEVGDQQFVGPGFLRKTFTLTGSWPVYAIITNTLCKDACRIAGFCEKSMKLIFLLNSTFLNDQARSICSLILIDFILEN